MQLSTIYLPFHQIALSLLAQDVLLCDIIICLYWGNYKIIYLSVLFFVCAASQMAMWCVISALCYCDAACAGLHVELGVYSINQIVAPNRFFATRIVYRAL